MTSDHWWNERRLPIHWRIARLKELTTSLDGYRIPLNAEDRANRQGNIPYWGAGGVLDHIDSHLFDETLVLLGEDGAPFFESNKDVAYLEQRRCWVNNHIHVLRPRTHVVDPQFLVYALNAVNYSPFITGSTRGKLTAANMRSIDVPLPPLSEQRLIVRVLDGQTVKVQALVERKRRLLPALQRETDGEAGIALTGGLKTGVREDSGIEWIGVVPTDWNVRRLGTLFRERDERGDPDLRQLEVSVNTGVTVRQFTDDRIERVAADLAAQKIARRGDLVFNKMRMWQGAVGVAPEDGLVSTDYTVAVPTPEIDSRYVALLLKTQRARTEIDKWSHGMVRDRNRLYWIGFKNIHFPVPPRDEQEQILKRVAVIQQRARTIETRILQAIEKLQEYRAALITAAVTGQIDVSEAA